MLYSPSNFICRWEYYIVGIIFLRLDSWVLAPPIKYCRSINLWNWLSALYVIVGCTCHYMIMMFVYVR